jgi:DNA-binding NarL/FixJ family response regulator
MGKGAIKIVLADAQYLARAGFKHLFAGHPGVEVVGEAAEREALVEMVGEKQPQVVVMDYHNGHEFTMEDVERLRREFPGIEVMLVTDDQDKARIRQVLAMGVNCILTKHCSPEEIVSAVVAVAKGEKFFCNKVLEIILEKEEHVEDCSPSNLSPREIEIVRMIASGENTKEIADKLCLSTHTVYTHRKNIMRKLQINSASEMILYAMKTGIVDRGPS